MFVYARVRKCTFTCVLIHEWRLHELIMYVCIHMCSLHHELIECMQSIFHCVARRLCLNRMNMYNASTVCTYQSKIISS